MSKKEIENCMFTDELDLVGGLEWWPDLQDWLAQSKNIKGNISLNCVANWLHHTLQEQTNTALKEA